MQIVIIGVTDITLNMKMPTANVTWYRMEEVKGDLLASLVTSVVLDFSAYGLLNLLGLDAHRLLLLFIIRPGCHSKGLSLSKAKLPIPARRVA